MNAELKSLSRRLLASSVALSLVLLAASACFTRWGKTALPALAQSLSEISLEQGLRSEAAGDLDGALAHFERALAGHFHGETNRNHCEKRLGVVLYRLGRYDEALVHLDAAQKSPLRSLNGFGPQVDTLMALERWDDARTTAERWSSESEHDAANRANALCALGQIALHQSDLADAEQRFQSALALQPDHAARGYLAQVYAVQGDVARARATLVTYLASAPWNEITAAQWKLLESWMPQGPSRAYDFK